MSAKKTKMVKPFGIGYSNEIQMQMYLSLSTSKLPQLSISIEKMDIIEILLSAYVDDGDAVIADIFCKLTEIKCRRFWNRALLILFNATRLLRVLCP